MPQRSSHEAAYAVPEPGPSHVYLSSNGTVNNIYEKGQGFFTPLSLKQFSVRTQHIRRLLDIMHVCLEKGDRARAARAWTILVRCPEVKPASAGWSKVAKEFDSKGRQTSARTVAAMTDRLLSNISRGPTCDDFDYLETCAPP